MHRAADVCFRHGGLSRRSYFVVRPKIHFWFPEFISAENAAAESTTVASATVKNNTNGTTL